MRHRSTRVGSLALLVVAVGLAVFGAAELPSGARRSASTDLTVVTAGAIPGPHAVAERVREPVGRGLDLWRGPSAALLLTTAAGLVVLFVVHRVRPARLALTWRRRGPPRSLAS